MRAHLPAYASTQLRRQLRLIRGATWGFSLLLALGFCAYVYFDHQHSHGMARDRLSVLTDLLAESVDNQMGNVERQLMRMHRLLNLRSPESANPSVVREMLVGWCQMDPACMDLLVLDARGEIEHWTGDGDPPRVGDREYSRVHTGRQANGLYLGIPRLSRVHTGQWFAAASLADRDEQGRLRKIYVSIRDLSRSFDYADLTSHAPDSSFAVVGSGGEVYVREPDREFHMGKTIPDVAAVLAPEPGQLRSSVINSRLDKVERLIVTRTLEDYPLFVAATQTTGGIYGPWRFRALPVGILWLTLTGIALYVGRRLADDARLQNYLASIDWLTGILNRRALMSEARRQEDRRSCAGGLGLMMIDIDHFKRINDNCGHAVGDEVLRRVAETLRMSSRGSDILGRYGGEEFLLLLPGADADRISKIAEKLRSAVEAIPALEFGDRPDFPETLTVSIGCAILGHGGPTLDNAISSADRALYEAKNAGRNRVVIASAKA